MAYKTNDSCLAKAHDDEPIFVLMARDPEAPAVVMEWIKRSIHTQPDAKLREAFEWALEMKNKCTEIKLRNMENR